ncbi:MAG: hypothetical protein HKN28_04360, partial [Alphaproteobacteria bacterium]|nr:hypothetical protein [Alphaproteobacteria bacterium]
MNKARLRFRLLTGLNILAGSALLILAFDEFQVTRGLVDDGILLMLILATFILVPIVSVALYILGRKSPPITTPGWRIYKRLSIGFLTLCWLAITGPALFWGAIIIAAREPWPLSLAQGPDTERSREGVERLFGADAARAMSSVYLISFHLRDGSYFVRFDYRDPDVIDQIAETKDMVKIPLTARDDGRFDLRAYRDRLRWGVPEDINGSDAIY